MLLLFSKGQHQNHVDTIDNSWTHYIPKEFLNPCFGYKFAPPVAWKLVDRVRDLFIILISAILTSVNCYRKCSAVVGLQLQDDFYLLASDLIITLCMSKGLVMTSYNSCSVIICLVQLIRTVVFCKSDYELYTQDYAVWYFLLLLLYSFKLWLLVLLLKHFSVSLQSLLLLQGEGAVSVFPITITYFTRRSLHWVDYASGNLLILMLIIQELENTFLKRREKVLADDNSNDDIYYDSNMDITACYIKTKQKLQQCEADYEDLNEQFDQYTQDAENQRKELQKQINSLEKDLSKLKETNNTDMKELRCCICQDKQSNILLQPCNHLSLCEDCLKKIKSDHKFCPLCRKKIKETIKVFL